MKSSKLWSLIIVASVCLTLSGCAKKAAEPIPPDSSTGNVVSSTDSSNTSQKDTNIDVDLTTMSSTMVYGEVFDIMANPDAYIGKTIKLRGQYFATFYEPTGKYYHSVVIQDATACCSQGIEFVWDQDRHVYPDEYPPDGTEVEITGIFETYTEEGSIYGRLATDEIVLVGA